jgi:hypothetical protein
VRQRIIAGYHLRPLDRQEVQAYIEHRLVLVGWKKDPAIGDEAYDAIFKASGGIPRRINNLCDRLMLLGALGEEHEFNAGHVKAVLEEMEGELGQPESPPQRDQAAPPSQARGGGGQVNPRELAHRIHVLEQEVQQLRTSLARTRRLVKQAIMLQMDAEDEEDAL